MKKLILFCAAIFTMAQMNAATPETPVNNEATNAEAPALTAANDDDYESSSLLDKTDAKINKHWAFFTDGFYLGMGIKHNWDAINNSFEVGFLNVVGFKYTSLHGQTISLGAGIHHRSYSMKRPNMLIREDDGTVEQSFYPSQELVDIKNRTSNLNQWSVQFPLIFRQRIVKKFDISVAGILNWNTYARVDNHYESNNIDFDTRFKGLRQTKVNFDFMGCLTWSEFGIYCRYTPGKFFKEGYGPKIKNTWTMGLVLGL